MLADLFDAFFFDLDGVVYISRELTPGAQEALSRLRERDKTIRFLTNNPTTRKRITKRLHRMGIDAKDEEVITSGWVTGVYAAEHGIRRAWVLGDDYLKEEIANAGVKIVNDFTCDAVIAGWGDSITLAEIRRAALAIHNGATFIATNADCNFPSENGPLAAVGAVVEALHVASGRSPQIIGKPYSPMFLKALDTLTFSSDKAVMIGDTPSVDILGAHQIGMQAILMGENISFPFSNDYRNADAHIVTLLDLFDPDFSIREWQAPSHIWPQSVEPGVAGVVFNDKGEVLLMKRADNGLWGIPSGHIEPAEKVEHAIIREIFEETGLEVEVQRLIGVYSDPASQIIRYPDLKICHFITTCFECKMKGGILKKTGEETLNAGFFDPQKLPTPLMPMHPQWLSDALSHCEKSYIR